MLAFGQGVWNYWVMQGVSRPDRELLDAAALCSHLLGPASVHMFLAEHRRRLFPDGYGRRQVATTTIGRGSSPSPACCDKNLLPRSAGKIVPLEVFNRVVVAPASAPRAIPVRLCATIDQPSTLDEPLWRAAQT